MRVVKTDTLFRVTFPMAQRAAPRLANILQKSKLTFSHIFDHAEAAQIDSRSKRATPSTLSRLC